MKIGINTNLMEEVTDLFDITLNLEKELNSVFEKNYGKHVQDVIIGIFCMNSKFAPFFKPRKVKYYEEAKVYIHKGVMVSVIAGTFVYELRLNHEVYSSLSDIRNLLAKDVLSSLVEIKNHKKIKDFDFDSFDKDFRDLLRRLDWL